MRQTLTIWIENTFVTMKDWRPVAIRYDQLPKAFLSATALAALIIYSTRLLNKGFFY